MRNTINVTRYRSRREKLVLNTEILKDSYTSYVKVLVKGHASCLKVVIVGLFLYLMPNFRMFLYQVRNRTTELLT